MKDVIERLDRLVSDAEKWGHIAPNIRDLKALLSYIKQCEEALRPFSDAYIKLGDTWNPWEVHWNEGEGLVDVGHLRAARQALSLIQQGEG